MKFNGHNAYAIAHAMWGKEKADAMLKLGVLTPKPQFAKFPQSLEIEGRIYNEGDEVPGT